LNVQGFMKAFIGEVFRVATGILGDSSYGLIVSLSKDDVGHLIVGSLALNPYVRVTGGSKVYAICQVAGIRLGDFIIGALVDPVGNLILASSRVDASFRWSIESPAPGIISRQSVFEPLATGILSIDSMIPIGRGQRELIVGDRQTGKTSIGVDTILNQRGSGILAVYVPIGQKASSILEVYTSLIQRDSIYYLSLVVSAASVSAVCQYLSAYTGCALAEYFMIVKEVPSFLMLDDLSRHAVSYREIYLLLKRPPGREAYPGEIFFVHSRLLERSAKLNSHLGGGSVTSFPVVETLAGDVSAYITTNVISITDGQVFLSIDLFLSGIKPACDVGLSVSRVGSAAQWDGMRLVSGSYKLELAQYIELQAFSQFASDLGEDTKARLLRGGQLVEMLKQVTGSPLNLSLEVSLLSLANQEVIKSLTLPEVTRFVSSYITIPRWVFLFVSVRLVSLSILSAG